MGVANVPAASAAGLQPKYQKFTSSGTFTLPTGYGVSKPLLINIQVIGGGGGGSGYTNDSISFTSATSINSSSYFGGTGYYTNTETVSWTPKAGGSGGIAATQMYLTSNLTITVGAAGTRNGTALSGPANFTSPADTSANGASNSATSWENNTSFSTWTGFSASAANGGSGGTSTAGSVSATGGAGGNMTAPGGYNRRTTNFRQEVGANFWSYTASLTGNAGAGGTPAGTAGDATPLLGTIAGGSSNATSIKGSFGVGGILGDAGTSTGVEGTGGGGKAIAASGAVIITWWE